MRPIEALEQLYKEAAQRYKTDPAFKKLADYTTLRLQQKDPRLMPIWRAIRSISIRDMDEIYEQLNIKWD